MDNSSVTDDGETDTDYFMVEEKSDFGDVTTQIAPADDELTGDDFEEATLTDSDTVADGDHLLLSIENFGHEGALSNHTDGDLSSADGQSLSTFFQDVGVNMTIEDPSPNADNELDLDDFTVSGTSLEDYDGDLVVALEYQGDDDFDTDQSYDLTYTVTEDNPFVSDEDEEVEIENEFTIEEGELSLDDANEEVPNSEDAEITGTTNAAPGSEVDTSVRASGTFTESEDVEVASDGTFTATYDFSEYDTGTEFTIEAENTDVDGEDEQDAVLVEAGQPDINIDTSAPGEVTVGDDASLDVTVSNDGGAAEEVEIGVDIADEPVASENVTLEPGDEWSESYDFDTSEAGDVSWGVTAGDESASGTLTVAEETPDDSGSEDSGSEDSGSEDSGSEDSGSDDDGESSDGTPGFGVAVAAIALLAAAMLALRRQD
ncbi:BGTF surface domain-containing protein [Halopiger xanaduensis]|nr:BGTF surface domain-containing protein [Halopiger xanaduensis]